MSIKDTYDEIIDDFKGRFRNPLILSFILVWLYKHWQLVYMFFEYDNSISVDNRITLLSDYINKHQWKGMVLEPLGLSFLALISFYIIGVLAQSLKVLLGQNLPAFIISKIDSSKYITKVEHKKLKTKLKKVESELNESEKKVIELSDLITQKEDAKNEELNQLNVVNIELSDAKKNINYNKNLKNDLELTLIHLFYKQMGNKPSNFNESSDIVANDYSVISGNWNVGVNRSFIKELGGHEKYVFQNNEVLLSSGSKYGTMENFIFDKKFKTLTFLIYTDETLYENVSLIMISADEFIGFKANQFCRMQRAQGKYFPF